MSEPEVPSPDFHSTAGTVSSDPPRGVVVQRNTYNTKLISVSIRMTVDDFEKIESIRQKLNIISRSEVVRQAISLYYNLLSNVKEGVKTGSIIIQNPIINIVKAEAKAESKAAAKVDVNNEIVELVSKLYGLRNTLPPLQREIVEKLYRKVESVILGDK